MIDDREPYDAAELEAARERDEIVRKAQRFAAVVGARVPFVTYTLAAVLVAVFGLEFLFGGTQSVPVLLRMGALSPEHVRAGEIWRLFSCTFLHSGPMHLLFNTYVLYVLGSSLERILGVWRFLVLYGLSCLGASLVSLAFLDGFSVGASGGLWGLLGAEAVLAWRSRGLLPRVMIRGARQAAVFNLGINLLNSFRPHVDMWAHFGGGAVGGALLLSGVLTRGLPRLGELEDDEPGAGAEALAVPSPPALKAAGGAVAAVLVAGLALGLAIGRPWTLRHPVELVRTPLPSLGVSLLLPPGLEPVAAGDAASSVQVGDLRSDPGAAVVSGFQLEMADETAKQRERAALVERLRTPPSGARLSAGPDEVTIAGAPGLSVRYVFDSGVEEALAFAFFDGGLFKVDVLRWPELGDAVPDGYAVTVLDSLEFLEPSP